MTAPLTGWGAAYLPRVPRAVAIRFRRPALMHRVLAACAAAACAAGLAAPRAAHAQRAAASASASGPSVGPYERARRLVEQGQGALGRAVADSLVAASPAGSPALAEALWWRATLSADAPRAEQDLRRIADEFPTSPRAGDVAVRLAQLDIARDRPDVAAPALARLVRERPDDPARAQAGYWLARARLELGDTRGACAALGDAAVAVRSSETATRLQIGDLRRRLPACDPASAVAAVPGGAKPPAALEVLAAEAPPPAAPPRVAPSAVAPSPVAPSASAPSSSAPSPAAASPTPGFTITDAPARGTPPRRAPAPFEVKRAGAATAAAPAPAPSVTAVAAPKPAPAARVAAVPVPKAAAPTPAPAASPAPAAASPTEGGYAVQLAAYAQRGPAESLAERLRARGLEARVTGAAAPFRVKVGRYPTRAAASAERTTLAGQGLAGFVTDAGDGPRP